MDQIYIRKIIGAKAAEKLCDADLFNDHMSTAEKINIDWDHLDDMLKGATILGVEPIDRPRTDGVYLHMKLMTGEVVSILIEEDVPETSLPAELQVYRYNL